jgi:hypothetical protein
MGREIRMVPANWEHPRRSCPHSPLQGGCDEARAHDGECYQPMFDEDFDAALKEWLDGYNLWKKGEYEDQQSYDADTQYWDLEGAPPDPAFYHHGWTSVEWVQMYETVSEGTPVTPPFSTKEELVDYLVEHGDAWDQHRGDGGWERENAERFVSSGWAPSLMVFKSEEKVEIFAPRDGA